MAPIIRILGLAVIGTSLSLMSACGARSAPAASKKADNSSAKSRGPMAAPSAAPPTARFEPYTTSMVDVPGKGMIKRVEFPSGWVVDLPDGARVIDGGIVVRSPASETEVVAGQSFPVLVEAANGFSPTDISIVSRVAGGIGMTGKTAPLAGTLRVPRKAVGEFTLAVLAINDKEMAFAEVPMRVRVNANLKNVFLVPPESTLSYDDDGRTLGVIGVYDDGVQRVLTDSGTPIKFWSENPEVAEVDDTGLVKAVSAGKAVIKSRVGQHEAQMTMHVKGVARPQEYSSETR